jgi:hypothetical protein
VQPQTELGAGAVGLVVRLPIFAADGAPVASDMLVQKGLWGLTGSLDRVLSGALPAWGHAAGPLPVEHGDPAVESDARLPDFQTLVDHVTDINRALGGLI